MREWRDPVRPMTPSLPRPLLVLLAALALTAPPALAQQESQPPRWPTEAWNPRPLPDDLVLPLPCGGAMAFRPVATPMAEGALADRPVVLGQPDPETDYTEYLRQAFVAGPFAAGRGGAPPRYYLTKYEVTRDQYAAVTAETCPALPTPAGRLPQAEVSWHDAVAFTARLSGWLLRNARGALPTREDAVAFVRLPTEEEWEYAARGGAAVAEAEFGARTYPMPGGMQRHAWYQGPRSAAGRARPVGALEPNPLGLFDMLGNVAEWALEPYRLNKVGRPHGLVGGLVARGGDFLTGEAQLRSSLRVELPPYRPGSGEPMRARTIGFRPALGLVATTSDARPEAFHRAFRRVAEPQQRRGGPGAAARRAARRVAGPGGAPGPLARRGDAARRAPRARRAGGAGVRSQIEAAASLARQVLQAKAYGELFGLAADQQAFLAEHVHEGLRPRSREVAGLLRRRAEEETPQAVRQMLASYLRMVGVVARSGDAPRITAEGGVVTEELRAQGLAFMPELAQAAVRHIVAAASGAPPTPERAERDIMAVLAPPAPARTPPPQRPSRPPQAPRR
jgi:hypothetical protein